MQNKKQKLIILVVISICIVGVIFYARYERRQSSLVNPQIYPAFRKIENNCYEYIELEKVEPLKYDACKKVTNWLYHNRNSDFVSSEKGYNFLSSLGFELPPYKLSRPYTENENKKAMDEQDELLKIRNQILEKQTEEFLNEAKEQLDDFKNNKR
ncbi:hypothetical protein KAJ89_02455 [Candidatus Parcubacteria bacterium]|nr:hypothetical protein [Candidatus Parcubacteria bacterium]